MKYFVFSFEGEGLPIAWKLHQAGHEVTVGLVDGEDTIAKAEKGNGEEDPIRKKKRLRLFDGLLNKVPARQLIRQMATIQNKKDYFVFCDMNLVFKFAEQAKDLGFEGNFPTEEDYCFEIDRQKAKLFVEQHYNKLSFIENQKFSSIADAKEFILHDKRLWVAKGFDPEANVFIPETNHDDMFRRQLCAYLDQNREIYERSGFILERFIKNLIELTPERIYYDGKLLGTNVCFENKQIGSGNISFLTGCAADLVLTIDNNSRLANIAFPPIVDELAKQHKGLFFWDASLLIDADTNNIYFGEFCPNRPGYNPFYTETAPYMDKNDYFQKVIRGESPYNPTLVGTSTRVFNLARTADDSAVLCDVPIELNESNSHILPMDIYKSDDQLLVCGYDTNLLVVTGTGNNIQSATDIMFSSIDAVSFGKKYYRPKFDYLSREYPSSILNRIDYVLDKDLISVSQHIIGDLKR